MKTVTISAHYVCDACNTVTADTGGDTPSGWEEILRESGNNASGIITITAKQICDVCIASISSVDIRNIRDALVG